jgi:glutathione S-transferase
MTLPCLWICAAYVNDAVAAGLGGVWLAGRVGYAVAYAREPALRAKGFTVGALAFGALGLAAGGGVLWNLLGY